MTVESGSLPNNLKAEQAFLGACLTAPAPVELLLGATDAPAVFYRQAHREIAAAIVKVADRKHRADIVTVGAELRRQGLLDGVGGTEYLQALCHSVPTSLHAREYWATLARCYKSRLMIEYGQAMVDQAYADPDEPVAIANEVRDLLSDLVVMPGMDFEAITPLGDHIRDVVLPRVMDQARAGEIPGFQTGWPLLDDRFLPGGLQPGRVTVLMARRKVGKSTMASWLAKTAAASERVVGFYSAEMSETEIALKTICQSGNLAVSQAELGTLDDEGLGVFRSHAGFVQGLPIYVNDRRGLDVRSAVQWFRRLKREHGLGLAVVDYLQAMAPHMPRESMERNYSDATRQLLIMAQELDCHVLLLSQLNTDGFAKWSGQTNDDAHINWRVVRCDDQGNLNVEGDHWQFHIEQRFGHSGITDRLYKLTPETGRIDETYISSKPAADYDGS